MQRIQILLRPEQKVALLERADGRSLSEVIRRAIDYYLAYWEQNPPSAK